MKLYIVRHGETDWNIEARMQGHTDIPLNSNGHNQAQSAAKKLKDINFDLIIFYQHNIQNFQTFKTQYIVVSES